MSKFDSCDRCPDEHTKRCETCNPDNHKDEITIERVIKYFEDENERYKNVLGDQVNILEEYRINLIVIDKFKKDLLWSLHGSRTGGSDVIDRCAINRKNNQCYYT